MEGDNAYEAEGHGKQKAKKGIRFKRFPPVLNIHLKRFEFDFMRDPPEQVKVNAHFEFSKTIDLSPFAKDAGEYTLHSVVVHSGDVNAGHYVAHVRPTLAVDEEKWVKFDDEVVTFCNEYSAMQENFGGVDTVINNYFVDPKDKDRSYHCPPRTHSAYILVYVRTELIQQLLRPVDPEEINPQLVEKCRVAAKKQEERQRERLENQTTIKIRVVLERQLHGMLGFRDVSMIQQLTEDDEEVLKLQRTQTVLELREKIHSMLSKDGRPKLSDMALFVLGGQYSHQSTQFKPLVGHVGTKLSRYTPQYSMPHFDPNDPHLNVLALFARAYDPKTLQLFSEAQRPSCLDPWDEKMTMLVVKYFCPGKQVLVTLGAYYIIKSQELSRMLIAPYPSGSAPDALPWVQTKLKPLVADGVIAPLTEGCSSIPVKFDEWMLFDEGEEKQAVPKKIRSSVAAESLETGDTIVLQRAEREEPQIEDNDPVKGPRYAQRTFAQFAARASSALDVRVLLHDSSEPHSLDGVAADGSYEGQSTSSLQSADRVERDIKMDSRWTLGNVNSVLAHEFGLPSDREIWLWYQLQNDIGPSGTPADPINVGYMDTQNEVTLGEVKKSFRLDKAAWTVHAVAVPPLPPRASIDNTFRHVCIRYFDSAVTEVANFILVVPWAALVSYLVEEVRKRMGDKIPSTLPLRVVEMSGGRQANVLDPTQSLSETGLARMANALHYCLRVEPAEQVEGEVLVPFSRADRLTGSVFGHPFLLSCPSKTTVGDVRKRVQEKLKVPDPVIQRWRLVKHDSSKTPLLKDDEQVEFSSDSRVCLEYPHPCPSRSSMVSRGAKPLVISKPKK